MEPSEEQKPIRGIEPKSKENATLVLILGTGLILLVAYGIVYLLVSYPSLIRGETFVAENDILATYFLNNSNWAVHVSNWTCGNTNVTVEFLEPTFNGLRFNSSSGAAYNTNKPCVRKVT